MEAYFKAIWAAVGGRLFLIPGFVSSLVGFYNTWGPKFGWPEMSAWALIPLAATPIIIWVVVGLLIRIVSLEKRLESKINVSAEIVPGQTVGNAESKWVRLVVAPATDTPLENCSVQLVALERMASGNAGDVLDERIYETPVNCYWSNKRANQEAIKIAEGLIHPADIFAAYKNAAGQQYSVRTNPEKPALMTAFQTQGKYRVHLAVSAQDCLTKKCTLILDWHGYDDMSVAIEDVTR